MYRAMDEGGSRKDGEAVGLVIYCGAKANKTSYGVNVGDEKKIRNQGSVT